MEAPAPAFVTDAQSADAAAALRAYFRDGTARPRAQYRAVIAYTFAEKCIDKFGRALARWEHTDYPGTLGLDIAELGLLASLLKHRLLVAPFGATPHSRRCVAELKRAAGRLARSVSVRALFRPCRPSPSTPEALERYDQMCLVNAREHAAVVRMLERLHAL